MQSFQVVWLTSGNGFFAHTPYLAQSQVSIASLSGPQPMQLGCFLRSCTFLNSHFLALQVSSLPYNELSPCRMSLMAQVASIIPTMPGSMPTTPSVEHPPMLTCSFPHRQRQHRLSPPQQVTCASQPMQAPLSNFICFFMQQSLTMYLQVGLSEPSMMRSYPSKRLVFCTVMKGCWLIWMCGLMASRVCLREVVLSTPTVLVRWPICLCRLVTSTLSESKSPIVPTPAAARQRASGHPIPPAPTIPIFVVTIFTWPSYEISLSSICLEYRLINSPLRGYVILLKSGPFFSFISTCFPLIYPQNYSSFQKEMPLSLSSTCRYLTYSSCLFIYKRRNPFSQMLPENWTNEMKAEKIRDTIFQDMDYLFALSMSELKVMQEIVEKQLQVQNRQKKEKEYRILVGFITERIEKKRLKEESKLEYVLKDLIQKSFNAMLSVPTLFKKLVKTQQRIPLEEERLRLLDPKKRQ